MDTFALQKTIVNKAKKINNQENLRLLQMFIKNDIKFTENMNGCFIDLINVDEKLLREADDFLDMCIEVHVKNDERNEQIKQYAQEFEQHFVPVRSSNNGKTAQNNENEFLNAIKNDRNLNSLEKSIMKENLKFSLAENVDNDKTRKSITPKYSGLKARLLKNCRMATRNIPAASANASNAAEEVLNTATVKKLVADDDEDIDADVEGEIDDLQDIDVEDDGEIVEDEI